MLIIIILNECCVFKMLFLTSRLWL